MKIGLTARFGDKDAIDVGYVRAFAQTVEAAGFDSLWVPEHIVFFSKYTSRYPYHPDGVPPFGTDIGLFDSLLVFAAMSQVTTRLRFATSVMVLPERPALLTAKEIMTLDHLTEGRYMLGVGSGWSSEEYEALGVSFARRGKRFDEYIRAIRTAWREDNASFHGEFVNYDNLVLLPRPYTPGGPPFLIGGDSEPAMKRAVTLGDGWYSWWRGYDLEPHMDAFRAVAEAAGRDIDKDFHLVIGTPHRGEAPDALAGKADAIRAQGAKEMVLALDIGRATLEADVRRWADILGVKAPA
ncbi:MAG: LLM class F420-dependent oxidoreductase [Alphaproteobacteria bacterium]|nr:LLM class F420-dependent oxidoreductase [Alphaproteobacteria bacterium]MBU1516395.1 LLM class F420-dependent oxidoreductase [Alphaproteobacteria bacterium]MBU2093368.1 LLM class F420-dependent oxidoreductase [Alphaproteobacteria bacterium]MBU2153855.1 LLM class F420-dependent oxidoreductase [Alphaproteobacteria bacterium]MBU2307727.1 LLM class F420-dependent oxidoreductase [Alphaproteobacteria bacterium]